MPSQMKKHKQNTLSQKCSQHTNKREIQITTEPDVFLFGEI